MANGLGDFDASAIIYGKFTTANPTTGAPSTLGGTPAISVYKDNSTTQSTSGVTLTADFDSVVGLNHFAIDTSSDGTFYSAGSFFDLVITAGTVAAISAIGYCVGEFTIRKTADLKPTVAARTLDVNATGGAGIDWGNIDNPTTSVNFSGSGFNTVAVAALTSSVSSLNPALIDVATSSRLAPTVAARTLDVSTGGEAGIDWANVGTPSSSVNLSATGINNVANFSGTISNVALVGSVSGLNVSLIDVAISTRMATYTQPTGFLAATFPLTVASPTNITAGTITLASLTGSVSGLNPTLLDVAVSSRLAPTVAARTLDVNATGGAGIDWGNIDNPTSSVHFTGTGINSVDTFAGTISSVALVGSVSGLNVSLLDVAVSTGNLDLADGVEVGMTPRQAFRAYGAVLAGIVTGGGTGTELFRAAVSNAKVRVTFTDDSSGNRSAVAYDLT